MSEQELSLSTATARRPIVERHSIDYIPLSERRGVAWHQGPFWFGGNFILLTLAAGFLGPSLGLAVGWSVLAIVTGVCFGTFFMAFHANQGPRLGLPQMIQSRAQLGTQGAVFALAAAVVAYIGLIIFNVILAAEVIMTKLPGETWFWYPTIIVAALAIALIGHDLLHVVERGIAYVVVVFYGAFTIYAVASLGSQTATGGASGTAGFSWTAFLSVLSVAAGYQISYAIYVSDYSRYLPARVSARALITWTYLGAAGSAIWLMSLGAFLGDRLGTEDAVSSVVQVGNELVPGFGTLIVYISIPSLIAIIAVNSYGAMLTGASAIDGFVQLKRGLRLRMTGLVSVAVVSMLGALAIPEDFIGSFNGFITIALYLLVPWTAVNLVDFYFVRRGHYAISELFNPNGIYGRWPWRGVTAYLIGILAMAPFVVLFDFQAPIARALGGVDVSFLVGLVVAGLSYYILHRGSRLEEEADFADEMNSRLDAPAAAGNPVEVHPSENRVERE